MGQEEDKDIDSISTNFNTDVCLVSVFVDKKSQNNFNQEWCKRLRKRIMKRAHPGKAAALQTLQQRTKTE